MKRHLSCSNWSRGWSGSVPLLLSLAGQNGFDRFHAALPRNHVSSSLPVDGRRLEHGSTECGTAGRTVQRCLVIQDHAHRDRFQDRLQPAFSTKRLHECRLLQLVDNFRCDPTAYEYPTSRHHFQREISGLRPIERHTEVECLHTEITRTSQSST